MSPHIDVSSLPDISQPEMDFYDTSFFQHDKSRQLPTPEFVMQHWLKVSGHRFGVVKFEDMDLVVKFSSQVMLEEAVTMRAMKSAFPQNEIPVPEVFGWRCLKNNRFIYMSLIEGETLYHAWPVLTETDKESICGELRSVISLLQKLTRDQTEALIYRFFQLDDAGGPFSSIQSFNNFFFAVAVHLPLHDETYMDGPYRDLLPDDGNVYFAHGDLTLTNVMVVGEPGSYRIKAIIDWEQSGWYPEYWEYCKLLAGVNYQHEWREAGWVDKLMRPFEDEWTAYAEYNLWRNP